MKHNVIGRQLFNEVDHPPLFMIGDEVCLDQKQGFEIWAEAAPFFYLYNNQEPRDIPLSKSECIKIATTKKYIIRAIEQRDDSLIWNIENERITGFAYKNIYMYWLNEIIDCKDNRTQTIKRLYGVPEPFLKHTRLIERHCSETNQKTNSTWGMF